MRYPFQLRMPVVFFGWRAREGSSEGRDCEQEQFVTRPIIFGTSRVPPERARAWARSEEQMQPILFWFSFVDADGVAVGIENDGHVADGRLGWFDSEFCARFFEFGNG